MIGSDDQARALRRYLSEWLAAQAEQIAEVDELRERLTTERNQKITEALQAGMSAIEVGAAAGITRARVYRVSGQSSSGNPVDTESEQHNEQAERH
jgi:hypothetical protein